MIEMLSLVEVVRAKVQQWLKAPEPRLAERAHLEGKEGRVYVRWIASSKRVSFGDIEIKPGFDEAKVVEGAITTLMVLPVEKVVIEDVTTQGSLTAFKSLTFAGFRTVTTGYPTCPNVAYLKGAPAEEDLEWLDRLCTDCGEVQPKNPGFAHMCPGFRPFEVRKRLMQAYDFLKRRALR
jgi:hypothetical protein